MQNKKTGGCKIKDMGVTERHKIHFMYSLNTLPIAA